MNEGDSFGYGDFPDDHDDVPEGPSSPQRGWIPPDDRLWKHPSELSGDGTHAGSGVPGGAGSRQAPGSSSVHAYRHRDRHLTIATGLVGAAAMALAVTAGFALTQTPSSGPSSFVATDTSSVTIPPGASELPASNLVNHTAAGSGGTGSDRVVSAGPDVIRLTQSLRRSLVELVIDRNGTETLATGLAIPGSAKGFAGLAMTSADAISGATSIDTVSPSGKRQAARLVAADARTGVAVLEVRTSLPPARFADREMLPGQIAVAVCLEGPPPSPGHTGSPPAAAVAVGMVREVGSPATRRSGPSLIDSVVADAPLPPNAWGGVLLDARGEVAGLLDWQQEGGGDVIDVFVPAPLAVGTATQLANEHRVIHGWLGMVGSNYPGGGATVARVLPGSAAAAAGLRPGDVIQTVDGHRVLSIAELQARLYTIPPGSQVSLGIERAGVPLTLTATLTKAPS
jgi:S1-C subfamily serine protease